jgi:signal transduction histidine kinase
VRNALYAKTLYDQLQEKHAALAKLEALRDGLVHMVVHDMKTPLAAIYGSLDLLRLPPEMAVGADAQAECLDTAFEATERALNMANSLLDISRLEEGRMPLNCVSCDLGELAEEAVKSLQVLAARKKVLLTLNGRGVNVNADPELIKRVIANLVGNAIKFSPSAGTVALTTTGADQRGRLEVKDAGPGVAAKYHAMIFEKFGQVHAHQTREFHSTGLGLAFCKLAVAAHHGNIGLNSEVGEGSTFWFEVPTTAGSE